MPETLVFTGTPKQVDWGGRIFREMADKGWVLPDITDARFWIDHRAVATPMELAAAAQKYVAELDATWDSPFTESFPRTTKAEARQALVGLRRLAGSIGVVVLDLETTGLDKDDRIVEIAAVRWPTRDIVIDTVVNLPPGLAPADITGITTEEIAAAPSFESIADEVASWTASQHLITWNTRFDLRFLLRELRRSGCPPLRSRATCAMRLAGAWLELADWPSLEEAAEALGVTRDGEAHRAMPDVLTTCAVLGAMAEVRS